MSIDHPLDRTGWVRPDAVFDGTARRRLALRLSDGVVAEVRDARDAPDTAVPLDGLLSPGFLDLQVNGGGGALLNTDPCADALIRIAAAHRRLGTVALLPTVITDAPEVMVRAVDAVLDIWPARGIRGLHIEGPHIATARRGTHAAEHIRPLDDHTLTQIARLRQAGVPVLITVAPEVVGTDGIRSLTRAGAVVSLGHSAADADTARQAFAAGARSVTHLYNAMPPMLSRDPGLTAAAIASDAYVGLIADGHHVAPEMATLACRARPVAGRMVAVSDAMATVGGPDSFMLYGQAIRVVDGRLINAEGALAGAHLSLAEAIANLIRWGLDPDTSLAMGTTNPSALMGLPTGLIGTPASDIIVLDDRFAVTRVGL